MSDYKKISGNVLSVRPDGDYKGKKGKNEGKTIYKFVVDLALGDDPIPETGNLSIVETDAPGGELPFKKGDEVTFTIYPSKEPEKFPDTWFWNSPAKQNGYAKKEWKPDPNRETPEERALKNKHITRMACLNAANAFRAANVEQMDDAAGTVKITPSETVLMLAERFEKWVTR